MILYNPTYNSTKTLLKPYQSSTETLLNFTFTWLIKTQETLPLLPRSLRDPALQL